MNTTQQQNYNRLRSNLMNAGMNRHEVETLVKIERTLHRWHELECGTGDDRVTISVERENEDGTGKPFRRVQYMGHGGKWVDRRSPCRDMEKGALRRLAEIMSRHPDLRSYVQCDPRGTALYIIRPGDIPDGESVDAFYGRGIAISF